MDNSRNKGDAFSLEESKRILLERGLTSPVTILEVKKYFDVIGLEEAPLKANGNVQCFKKNNFDELVVNI
jgi:hypothetical protein